MLHSVRHMTAALVIAAALAGCGEKAAPDPRSVTPAVIQLPAMPAAPQWSGAYLGKPVAGLFPGAQKKKCYGSVDNVAQSDDAANPVAQFTGWAWDDKHTAPFDMILAVNGDGVVVGAGDVSIDRADVVAAASDRVTNPKVGFSVSASQSNGTVTLYGVQKKSGSHCQIGEPRGF